MLVFTVLASIVTVSFCTVIILLMGHKKIDIFIYRKSVTDIYIYIFLFHSTMKLLFQRTVRVIRDSVSITRELINNLRFVRIYTLAGSRFQN